MEELQCEICKMKFQTQVDLIDHREMIHSKFECPTCGAEFKSEKQLKAHEKKEHEAAA
ncbi:C2H2-type zinc finger protein [Candidatus Manganitrophus noduliformans]|uniref:C2H2-type domain-containing protein n=1 Tax=Candidatus Manganitrophus noduliformans TaxID=2606439 RepID=A0A7X6IAU0_9BACT|nr:C2H2-type zinc finger protein [Candidatus Manganitrophus noduliformans]NKE70720.1 hypothetical protein [Candidatus Manganitrophus noduliformans]